MGYLANELNISQESIQAGAIGLAIELVICDDNNVALDISSATVMKIIIKKPNREVLEKTAQFTTDGEDGKIRYITIDGDIDMDGLYVIQGYVELIGYKGYSSLTAFKAGQNLLV